MSMDLAFEEVDAMLRSVGAIKEAGGVNSFACQHGFSPSYVSEVNRHRRHISDRLAHALSFRKVFA